VDDDSDDISIFIDAVKDIDPLILCTDAWCCEDGINLLKNGLRPNFIFLDINTPRMDGFQCLVELKKNAELRNIPTIMYTTSSKRTDREKALQLGAHSFIVKPNGYKELKQLVEYALSHRWELIDDIITRRIMH